MKKSFFKKLAFVLAASMVVPAVVPAASGSAAAAPDFAKRQTNVYEGKSYSYTVKNVPAGGTVKWTATGAGKDYVKFSKKTGATNTVKIDTKGAMAAKNATASVKASVYNKAGKLVKGVGDGVTVKVSATALDIVVAEGIDMKALPADTAVKFSRKITPSNATSVTYWSVTKADGTAVDAEKVSIDAKGNFKASEKGDYKVTAEAKNAKTGKVVASKTVDVTVGFVLDKAAQLENRKIDLAFKGTVDAVKASDFAIVNDATKVVVPVKAATISDDKTKVMIDTLTDMADGKTYTVTYNGVSVQFTATDGKVAQIAIDPTTVEKETPSDITAVLKDSNGVVIKSVKYGSNTDSKLEFNLSTNQGYIDGNKKLVLISEGHTAVANATYHSYEYDTTTGEEKDVIKTGDITITAVAKKPVTVKEYKYTVGADNTVPNWNSFTQNTSLAVGDNNKALYLTLKKSDDSYANDYTFKSTDPSILLVNGKAASGNTMIAQISPVKAGTVSVLVMKDNDLILSLPVTVKSERKATSIVLGGAPVNMTISSSAYDDKKVTVKVKDNYGEDMNALVIADISVTCVSAPNNTQAAVNSNKANYLTVSNGYITFSSDSDNISAGTYVYKIDAKGVGQNLVLTAKAVADGTGLTQLAPIDSVDVKVTNADEAGKNVTLAVNKVNGGFNTGSLDIDKVVIKMGDTTYDSSNAKHVTTSAIAGTFDKATGSSIIFRANAANGTTVTKIAAGDYSVSATCKDGTTVYGTFKVSDSQSGLSWNYKDGMDSSSAVGDGSSLILALEAIFKFNYEGTEISTSNYIASADVVGPTWADGTTQSYFVKSITVKVTVGDSLEVPITVTVNQNVLVQ